MPSAFISFEGIDGCGKSTQIARVARHLEEAGIDCLCLREPGGTAISEQIRALVLDNKHAEMSTVCELLLYEAARAQLVHELIAPALDAGKVVLCDRFYDSTTAYQAYAGGLDVAQVQLANQLAAGNCHPDVTLVFDLSPECAAARSQARGTSDRIEAKGLGYQQRVAAGFRAIAEADSARVKLVDATGTVDEVFERVLTLVAERVGL
ncbi:dTMP kinase [Collinsella sp. zg1085]|uniref:dTMP kinase n=1 Tax=Collinsella sp. zg1085 TaxID=2844380 RepID=UPI001C0C5898|nr:dTMP kinase [Collinsella sp. zg1085]QWT17373.1 dTMP kinase [Collinsella sp. zg1085]